MRKINVYIYILCFLLSISFTIFNFNKNKYVKKLSELKYSNNVISLFKENNIDSYVADKNKYSKTLEKAISDVNYNKEYIDYYLNINYYENDNFIYIINNLINLNYTSEEINTIFDSLDDYHIDLIIKNKYKNDIMDFINLDYFNKDYLSRYVDYKKNNSNLDIEDIITYVNIGLDYDFYTNTNEVNNQNDLLVLVNKYHKLSEDFIPNNLSIISSNYSIKEIYLVDIVRDNFEKMCSDALAMGLTMKAGSGYRSYSYQNNLYDNYVKKDGLEKADTYSARAGHSEHQTGLAIDIMNGVNYIDENDDLYNWLLNNSYKYGFILRYPKDKENITGYMFEPWHFRYVGVDIAKYLYDNDLTLEEYFAKKKKET